MHEVLFALKIESFQQRAVFSAAASLWKTLWKPREGWKGNGGGLF